MNNKLYKEKKEEVKVEPEEFLLTGEDKKYISFSKDNSKITYNELEKTYSFKNPEEKVRASFYVELIQRYKYTKKLIGFEVKTKPDKDAADIVVYEDDEKKKPFIIVECKKDGISNAEFKKAIDQVFRYANYLRAKFAIVVAGTTRTAFNVAEFKPGEREKNVISDIPIKFGKIPKYKFIKGDKDNELEIVSKEDLIRVLEKAHDTVWQGGRLAPTTAFDEISKLLFCKLQDEKDFNITKKGEPYKFQIGTYETSEQVFKRVDNIYQKAKQKDSEVFKEDIKLSEKIVYSVVEHLQSINFNETDLDTKGVAFEKFMEDFFKGKMGQFFTPREIIRFCVKMLNPQTNQYVLDPACGSGGFLLNSMDYIKEIADKECIGNEFESYKIWHTFAKDNIFGIEINDQIARVCKMNMIIHDDGHSNIVSTDSLRNVEEISDIHRGFKKNYFDVILTNPPFGASVKSSEKDYLDKYALGAKNRNRNSQKTEILFIERCIDFIKPKTGKIGIVLPDGILTNSSLQYVRDFIMERCRILAVVSLPQFAFSHFGAGVKSSLVFLRRKGENETLDNYPIFMAIAKHIGYDATGRKDPVNDFEKIYDEYQKFRKRPKSYEGC
jgi:type I restriction enzyme M protein